MSWAHEFHSKDSGRRNLRAVNRLLSTKRAQCDHDLDSAHHVLTPMSPPDYVPLRVQFLECTHERRL